MARVAFSGQRRPVPNLPPVQPARHVQVNFADYSSKLCELTGVEQPAFSTCVGHALCQHRRIARRVKYNERLSKASREGRRWLLDAVFSTWGLRGVA